MSSRSDPVAEEGSRSWGSGPDAGVPGAAPGSLGSAHALLGGRPGEVGACFPDIMYFR